MKWGLLALFLLLLVPAVAAEQNTWDVNVERVGLGGSVGVFMSQTFPTGTVPIGGLFYSTHMIEVDENTLSVQRNATTLTQGCTLVSAENVPPTSDDHLTVLLLLEQEGPTCSVALQMSVLDGATKIYTHQFGYSVAGYGMIDLGQVPTEGGVQFWTPLVLVSAVFLFAFFFGLRKHPAWGLLLMVAFLGVLTVVLGAGPLTGAAVPAWSVFLAAACVVLMMYVLGGSGFKRREDEKQ